MIALTSDEIEEICKCSYGTITTKSLTERICSGSIKIMRREDSIVVFSLDGDWCWVVSYVGKLSDVLSFFNEIVMVYNVKKIRFLGRKGWEKVLKELDFKPICSIYEYKG